jgi:hypothetical protein
MATIAMETKQMYNIEILYILFFYWIHKTS